MSSRVRAFVNKWPCVVSHVLSDVGSLNGISLYRYRVEEERGRRNRSFIHVLHQGTGQSASRGQGDSQVRRKVGQSA